MIEYVVVTGCIPVAERDELERVLAAPELVGFRLESRIALGDDLHVKLRGPSTGDAGAAANRRLEEVRGAHHVRTLHVGREYTTEELESARYVVAWLGAMPFVDGSAEYDMSGACPTCGSGRRMPAAYRLDMAAVRKHAIAATFHTEDLVVTEEVASAIRQSGLTGVELVPGAPKSARSKVVPLFVLSTSYVWPPLQRDAVGLGRKYACESCDVTGWTFDTKARAAEVAYAAIPEDAPDFGHSYESLGWWQSSREGGARLLIVSQAAYRALRPFSKRLHFEPVLARG